MNNKITKEEISALLHVASRIFPNHEIDKELVNIWYSHFQNETSKNFSTAFRCAYGKAGQKFFPTFGEVQEFLDTKSPYPTSKEILTEAYRIASRIGVKSGRAVWERYLKDNDIDFVSRSLNFESYGVMQDSERVYEENKFKESYDQNLETHKQQNTFQKTQVNLSSNQNGLNFLTKRIE